MSVRIETGGAAFPMAGIPRENLNGVQQDPNTAGWASKPQLGMTLRDWFAGQALTGILLNSADIDFTNDAQGMCEAAGCMSYKLADAMLAARDGREGE